MSEFTVLEKTVYGVAAPDARDLFHSQRGRMSARILRVVQSVIDQTALTNQEAIEAWRTGMEAEFSTEVEWPADYSVQPTTQSKAVREILAHLETLGVSDIELDALEIELNKLTIPEPTEEI